MKNQLIMNWNRMQPSSLRHALELCKDHARVKKNMSVEKIADAMGVTDHWIIYKWFQTGRIPANLIHPYEYACGINYVSRWIAASAGNMLVPIPSGRCLKATDVIELHNGFGLALQLLTDLYAGKADVQQTLDALTSHMVDVAWHQRNVAEFATPQLPFTD